MNPSEQQLFTGSGTYIMNERVECSGYVLSVSSCGVLVKEREPWPRLNVYRFTLLHLRLSRSGDSYDILDRENVDYKMENAANTYTTTFNPMCLSHNISGWFVLQGDQFGVILYAHCQHSQFSSYCPIQIGLINTECTDSSLFVTSSVSFHAKAIPTSNTSQVAIKLNFDIQYDDNGKLSTFAVILQLLLVHGCVC